MLSRLTLVFLRREERRVSVIDIVCFVCSHSRSAGSRHRGVDNGMCVWLSGGRRRQRQRVTAVVVVVVVVVANRHMHLGKHVRGNLLTDG